MIKFAETLVVGESFTTTPQNPYAIAFSGIVSSVKHAGNYTIVETTNGGWHRIHNGQRVMVSPKHVTI